MSSHPALFTARTRRMLLSFSLAVGLVTALAAGASGSAQAGTGRALSARLAAVPGHAPSAAGTWKLLPAAPATARPTGIVSAWTGREMIIHGTFGTYPVHGRFTLAYRPRTRTWTRLARGPAWVSVQSSDIAVWTGSRMLVFGLTNASYNPAVNRWTPLTGPGGPSSDVLGWTGRQLIMWLGSCCGGGSAGAEAYSPATRTWHALPAAPLQTRSNASGTWTGKELVVAGGITPPVGSRRTFRNGAAYNPATRTWRKIAPMPLDHWAATAVWDGKEILFIGGRTGVQGRLAVRGLAYNPGTNHWRWLPAMRYPRSLFAAVWTGRQLLVWGGLTAGIPPPHGEAYNPAASAWTALPVSPLRGRASPTAVWTGRQLIVWGGYSSAGTTLTDGAAYTPAR
jgi:hypothetical protein